MKQQAIHLLNQKRFSEARDVLEKECTASSGDGESWMLLGMVNGRLGELSQALQALDRAVEMDPGNVLARINIANALQSLGRPGEAIPHLKHVLQLTPGNFQALAMLGNVQQSLGQPDHAVESYRQALAAKPDDAATHNNLGLALLKGGRLDAALASYRAALELNPDFAGCWENLGKLQIQLGEFSQAIAAFTKAVKLNGHSCDAWSGLGNANMELGYLKEAEDAYAHAHKLRPDSPTGLYNRGSVLSALGKLDEARVCYQSILKLEPDNQLAVAGMTLVLQHEGKFEQAWELLQPLIESGSPHPQIVWSLAALCHRFDACDRAINLLNALLKTDGMGDAGRRRSHFALGRLYDRADNHEQAFEHYRQGNSLRHVTFDRRSCEIDTDRLINVYSAERLKSLAAGSNKTGLPVFIVGMQRSGTSLVEQILASHPQVFGAGEVNHIIDLAAGMSGRTSSTAPYPQCVTSASADVFDAMADDYLQRMPTLDTNFTRVTDKMLNNFRHLGLIQLMFPNARIIHCQRHPLDVCLSCYFQDFVGALPWAFDLEDIGFYYRQYHRLMAHWRKVLTIPVFELQYEDLVADQEAMTRRLIDFLGLGWDDNCLAFHKSRREVVTASLHQVRLPIYSSSTARHRHYEQYLEPLKKALGDVYRNHEPLVP